MGGPIRLLRACPRALRCLITPSPAVCLEGFWPTLQVMVLMLPLNTLVTVGMALAWALVWIRRRGWRSLLTPLASGWVVWALWAGAATLFSPFPGAAAVGWVDLLPYLLMFLVFAAVVRTLAQLEQLAALLVLSSAPVSGLALLQATINRPDWHLPRIVDYTVSFGLSPDGRANSLFNHYNEAALYLAMLLPLMAYFAFGAGAATLRSAKPRLLRGVASVLLAAALVAIFLTSSRNAWGLVVLIMVVAILWLRRWALAAVIGVLVGALAWAVWGPLWGIGGEWLRVFVPSGLVERLLSTLDPSQPSFASTADRLNAWSIAFEGVQKRPILGWGLKTFQSVAGRLGLDHRNLPHEHNVFLMLALGTGLPGLIGFLALQIAAIRAALQIRQPPAGRQLVAACLAGSLVFVLSGFLDIFFYEPRVHLLGWLLLGIAYGVSQGPPSWAPSMAPSARESARDHP